MAISNTSRYYIPKTTTVTLDENEISTLLQIMIGDRARDFNWSMRDDKKVIFEKLRAEFLSFQEAN